MARTGWIALAVLLSGCATNRPAPPTFSTDWRVLQRVAPGTEVSVSVEDGIRRGRFASVSADDLVLAGRGGLTRLARENVIRVFERTTLHRRRTTNMLMGAAGWAMIGAALTLLVHEHGKGAFVRDIALFGAAEGAVLPTRRCTERQIYYRGLPLPRLAYVRF